MSLHVDALAPLDGRQHRTVLVTGGTGTLGRELVRQLSAAGQDVRVLARHLPKRASRCVDAFTGDVRTGEGVRAAAEGANVIVHAATNPRRRMRQTEIDGARHVAAAARETGAHLIYVSIVGVDRHRLPYYRAKAAAEEQVAASGASWTVFRSTQFHEFLDQLLRTGWCFRTPHLRFQPIDVSEAARQVTALAARPPQQAVINVGGPQVLAVDELAAQWRELTGRRTRLVRLPRTGFLRDFDDGAHLAPDAPAGGRTWQEWLMGSYDVHPRCARSDVFGRGP